MNRVAVMVGLLALTVKAVAADPTRTMEIHSLAEVRTLDALPREVNALLGRGKSGFDGIADFGKPFNMTDVVDPRLPMRRFILGGSSLHFVLVEYEQGGRGCSIHAVAFESQRTGWTQVGQWTLNKKPVVLFTLVNLLFPSRDSRLVQQRIRFAATQPVRRDGPLRAENITDEEVREIQAAMSSLCRGLQLSRISGHWIVGPQQQWWLDYERLEAQWRRISDNKALQDYIAEEEELYARYPSCGNPQR